MVHMDCNPPLESDAAQERGQAAAPRVHQSALKSTFAKLARAQEHT